MHGSLLVTRAVRRFPRPAALLVWALLAAVLGCVPALAARFGVPAGPGVDPSGYFILVASDAVNAARSVALGDWARTTTLYIEVATRGLRVDLYDPGVFDPAGGANQLDENVDTVLPLEPAQLQYVLRDPMGVVIANVTYGPDTPATERQLVNLYNNNGAATGVYRLTATLLDGVADEHDITVFGVSVPGHQVFTYNLTGGQLNQAGATIAEPLVAYPWLVAASAGSDAVGPVCGASFISYDLDATLSMGNPVEPPSTDVTTRRGYTFPAGEFPPSGDARWTQTLNGGLPFGLLDSNDHGIWNWAFSDLTVPENVFGAAVPPFDLNCFSIQILDYNAPPRDGLNWPSAPPFGDGNPRRLYLPEDDGSAPARAWLGHSARVVAGFPVIAQGELSTLEVTLELGNPHAYALTSVVGESHVTPDLQVSDPTLIGTTGGLVAAFTGRRLDFSGTIPPGTTASVTYSVDITPTTLMREFLTGDDVDFVSPGAPTRATYLAPYNPSLGFLQETLGPACQIEYEPVVPACVALAQLTAERLRACPGTPIQLDGLMSQVLNCPGGVPIYQWSVNAAVSRPFPAPDTISVTPFLNDTWTLEVACSTDPMACIDSDQVTFDLYPAVGVTATASRTTICPGDAVDLDALTADGTPPYTNGRWSTQPPGAPGDGSTQASLTVNPTVGTTYTWSIEDALGCTGSDDVIIVVDAPTPVITPGALDLCAAESRAISADPGHSSYLWTTNPVDPAVEGAISESVMVSQVGTTYTVTVTNALGCSGSAAVTPGSAPPLTPAILPLNPELCTGGSVALAADPAFASHLWSTLPVDPAVEGASTPDVVAQVVGTQYTVTVTDARGCSGSTSVTTTARPDPVPGPVGPSLRVTRSGVDVELAWLDIANPTSGYEAVVLDCPTRDYRASCAGRVPDAPTMTGAGTTGAPVAPGTQAATHSGAVDLGDMLFYLVRALSPCTAQPGPVR